MVRLYVNCFKPSFELRSKTREGAKVKKQYHKPSAPCDRVLAHPSVWAGVKEALRAEFAALDPLEVLYQTREDQGALAAAVLAAMASKPLERIPASETRPAHAVSGEQVGNRRGLILTGPRWLSTGPTCERISISQSFALTNHVDAQVTRQGQLLPEGHDDNGTALPPPAGGGWSHSSKLQHAPTQGTDGSVGAAAE